MRPGDLVQNERYFGIVLNPQTRFVFWCNGLKAFLEREAWESLTFHKLPNGAAPAHFGELVEAWFKLNEAERAAAPGSIFE